VLLPHELALPMADIVTASELRVNIYVIEDLLQVLALGRSESVEGHALGNGAFGGAIQNCPVPRPLSRVDGPRCSLLEVPLLAVVVHAFSLARLGDGGLQYSVRVHRQSLISAICLLL